jgi:hypothetical protein
MSKRVYLFDEPNQAFNGFWDCQESPLEAGVYLQPHESTEVEPPVFDVSMHSCAWNGVEWILTEIPKAVAPQPNAPQPNAPVTGNPATPTVV